MGPLSPSQLLTTKQNKNDTLFCKKYLPTTCISLNLFSICTCVQLNLASDCDTSGGVISFSLMADSKQTCIIHFVDCRKALRAKILWL